MTLSWRARLQKKIGIDANEHRIEVSGREVLLTPPTPELKRDSEWLFMNARGFAGEDEARQVRRPPRINSAAGINRRRCRNKSMFLRSVK